MTPMESLLNAIDNAHPIELPIPKKRRLSMSISSIIDKRQCTTPPHSPKEENKIVCYHASVAQKSYGTEKRFLCPPPIVMTTKREASFPVSVSIVNDLNQTTTVEQRTTLDEHSKGYFKYLYVTGTAKSKQFRLKVNVKESVLYSNPITIISKPSKKISKTRNATSCLYNHSTVSLFNRINSQTVRTKYMSTDNNQLCAKHTTWSPFEIITVSNENTVLPLSYGTEIILKDIQTGITSPPFILRKVEKGKIMYESKGIVSQMQKVALELSTHEKRLLYLNSNGKTIQNESESIDFTRLEEKDDVDDYLCWTIVGISRFEQEIKQELHSIEHLLQPNSPPLSPRSIIPFPIINSIDYNSYNHTIRVTDATTLEYWLGRFGPLKKLSDFELELPGIQDIILHNQHLIHNHQNGSKSIQLPLLLSRNNGFLYHSSKSLSYHYSPSLSGRWSILDTMSHNLCREK